MKHTAPLAMLAVLFFPLLSTEASGYYEGFTHAVYVENVTATWCPGCRADQPLISAAYQKYLGSLHFVEFHVSDEWDAGFGMEKARQYQTTQTPTHAYDAGHIVKVGAVDEEKIDLAGKRAVHRVTLALLKRVEGGNISFEGSVKEEERRAFSGQIDVIAVENGLKSAGVTWNFVFRAYLLRFGVDLPAGGHNLFSGTWKIPNGVNVSNMTLIAAAFDSSDRSDGGGPFAVQSVSDTTSGAVIPEFGSTLSLLGIVMMAVIISLRVFPKEKRATRKASDSLGSEKLEAATLQQSG